MLTALTVLDFFGPRRRATTTRRDPDLAAVDRALAATPPPPRLPLEADEAGLWEILHEPEPWYRRRPWGWRRRHDDR